MISKDTRILCANSGDRKPVQDLREGDKVYNPLTQTSVEITNIISKVVVLDRDVKGNLHPLCPIRVDAKSVNGKFPLRTVWISPGQAVLVTSLKHSNTGIKVIDAQGASMLALSRKGFALDETLTEVRYFAIFTQQPCYMQCEGLLLSTAVSNYFTNGLPSIKSNVKCQVTQTGVPLRLVS